MTTVDKLKSQLQLPAISQIGFVVSDADRMAEDYSSVFGVGPWTVYDFAPDKHWFREELSPLKLRMAKAMLGDIELVLSQPLEGRSLHREFLETCGEGMHSLTFNTPDYDGMFERFVEAGFEPVMRAETYVEIYKGHLRACYFDTRSVSGTLFEIRWASWNVES
jgi:methylmalonyl-CoA/ethylmalonyl-CoA epimerase